MKRSISFLRVLFILFMSTMMLKVSGQLRSNYTVGIVTGKYVFSYSEVPDNIVEIIPAVIAGSTGTYQWYKGSTPEDVTTLIAGATQSSYSFSSPLNQTTYFKCMVSLTNYANIVYSNIIKVEVGSVNWEDLNYIREHDVLVAGITDWKAVDQLPIGQKLQTTTYLDGLGRPIQKVSRETATPATVNSLWGDVVQFSEYDVYGRESKQNLPYTSTGQSGKYKLTAGADQVQYYSDVYGETSPYTTITYYPDPLNRASNVKSPGTSWAAGGGNSTIYDLNETGDNVQTFEIGYTTGAAPVRVGAYAANTLFKTRHTDENGKQVIEYTNAQGQLILTKTQVDDNPSSAHEGWICVYSIYDDFGLLRYRLQPEAVKYLDANGWSFAGLNGQTVLDEQCFRYEYDEQGRNILKKAPGAKELQMLYDSRHRVVFMQDGNQRLKSPPEWTANLYDELDRPTITTLYHTTKSVSALQSDINSSVTVTPVSIVNPNQAVTDLAVSNRDVTVARYAAQNSIEFVDGFESGGVDFVAEIDASTVTQGYTVNTYTYNNPIAASDLNNASVSTIVKYQFYDDYTFNGVKAFDNNFNNTTAYSNSEAIPIAQSPRTISYPTGSMVRVLGTNAFLTSTEYYDDKGRHIQSIEDNIKSGKDVTTLQYNWDGRLMSTYTKHSANGGYTNFGILTKNLFDNIGRVTGVRKKYGSNDFKTIATYDFDDVGRLKTKHLDPGYTGSNKSELEGLGYSYNIHNNITGINKDYALKTPGKYYKWENFFGLYLGYDNRDNVFNAAQLDGHVAGLLWNTMGDDAQRKYDYQYDNAGRLSKATFTERKTTGDSWDNSKMDFSVAGRNGKIAYDLNGNLLFMLQRGVIPGNQTPLNVDDLAYSYNDYSNRLKSVSDASNAGNANGTLQDFKDGANGSNDDYIYDDNGNLVIDLNKNVKELPGAGLNGIVYNFLDKPEQIRIAGKGTIQLVYDAEGNKLQKKYTAEGSATTKTTTYINQFVYEGNNLQYINFEEGRIRVIQPASQSNGYDVTAIDGNMNLPNGKKGAYDYYIRDYQENVRMILTEESHYSLGKCTMETDRATIEEPVFGQTGGANEVVQTRIPVSDIPGQTVGGGWQNSDIGSSVSRLSKLSKTVGPNSLLKVMAGDVVNATTQYYYQNAVTNGTNDNITANILNALIQSISGSSNTSSVVKGATGSIYANLNGTTPFITKTSPDANNTYGNNPKAYLSILFFDERFNYIEEGSTTVRVTDGGVSNATLTLPINTKAPKNGYAYVYVSNESDENVYFDNLQIAHDRGRIIEEDHYYAYGLKIAGISSKKLGDFNEGLLDNKNLYNDKELIEEGDLDWYDYGFRNYDPQIGRFPQLDPMTDDYPHYTPYQYAGNEPIANVDLDGLEELNVLGEVFKGAKEAVQQTVTVVGHATKVATQAGMNMVKTGILVGKATVQVGGRILKKVSEDAVHGITFVGTTLYSGGSNVANEIAHEGIHDGDAYDKKKYYTKSIWGFSWAKGFYISYDYQTGSQNTDDAERAGLGFGSLAGEGELVTALRRSLLKFSYKIVLKNEQSVFEGARVISSIDKFMESALEPGDQGLTEIGRAFQKHSIRHGGRGAFGNIHFSHKTANELALKMLDEILNSKNQVIRAAKKGGWEIFDASSGRGIGVSRNGLFNGFREL